MSLIAALGWGISPVIDKYILQDLDYLSFLPFKLLTRALYGFIVLYIFNKRIRKNIKNNKINNKMLALVFASGTISFLAAVTYFKALADNKGNILIISMISYVLPVVVIAVLSTYFFKKTINKQMILGIVITFIGVYITMKYTPK